MSKGGHKSTVLNGDAENFQNDSIGTFPTGWIDPGLFDPESTAPHPSSALVIATTGPDGNLTKALATLPAVAESQGIYRPISPTTTYKMTADVRVDQFGDVDPTGAEEDPNNPGFFVCGCPLATGNVLDWPMQAGFINLDNTVKDPTHAAAIAMVASTQTHTWHMFAGTINIVADIDLGLAVQEGKWYGTELDFNSNSSKLHGIISDATTGATLAEQTVFLHDSQYELFGKYDKVIDGTFNNEAFMDGELTLAHGTNDALNKPGLAVVDNIDTMDRHRGNSYGYGYNGSHDHDAKSLDYFSSDRR